MDSDIQELTESLLSGDVKAAASTVARLGLEHAKSAVSSGAEAVKEAAQKAAQDVVEEVVEEVAEKVGITLSSPHNDENQQQQGTTTSGGDNFSGDNYSGDEVELSHSHELDYTALSLKQVQVLS